MQSEGAHRRDTLQPGKFLQHNWKHRLKADSHIACRAHGVPMPWRAAKGLEWHSTAVSGRPCCAVALRRTTWSEHGMGAAWQVWIRHGHTV